MFNLSEEQETRALRLHQEALVINSLTYIPEVTDFRWFKRILGAGVNAMNTTIPTMYDDLKGCVQKLGGWLEVINDYSEEIILVKNAHDIEAAQKEKKLGIIFGAQNAKPIEDDLRILVALHSMGLRIMQLAYAEQNFVGSGGQERGNGGLSRFGLKVVEKMNMLGMLIDLSHCNTQTTLDAIEHSKDPVAITHANPRALCEHFRNKNNAEIIALAEKGGVIGITSWGAISERIPGVRPDINVFLDCVDYVVELVGDDYVGVGLDSTPMWNAADYEVMKRECSELCGPYSFDERNIKGLEEITSIPNVTKGLISRGYSDQSIKKILGQNFHRLFKQVWH